MEITVKETVDIFDNIEFTAFAIINGILFESNASERQLAMTQLDSLITEFNKIHLKASISQAPVKEAKEPQAQRTNAITKVTLFAEKEALSIEYSLLKSDRNTGFQYQLRIGDSVFTSLTHSKKSEAKTHVAQLACLEFGL